MANAFRWKDRQIDVHYIERLKFMRENTSEMRETNRQRWIQRQTNRQTGKNNSVVGKRGKICIYKYPWTKSLLNIIVSAASCPKII